MAHLVNKDFAELNYLTWAMDVKIMLSANSLMQLMNLIQKLLF
jgi:hypothetical protein